MERLTAARRGSGLRRPLLVLVTALAIAIAVTAVATRRAAPAARAAGETVAWAPGEVLEKDQWFVGEVDGTPSASMHIVVTRPVQGSGRTTRVDSTIVIQRTLGGNAVRMELRQSKELEEDATGAVAAFSFDTESDGQITTASGRIEAGTVVGSVRRLDRVSEQRLALPAGLSLLGEQAGQDLLVGSGLRPGERREFASLELFNGSLAIARCSALLREQRADGALVFTVTNDLFPIPMTLVLDARGDLLGMALDLVVLKLAFKPSDGPVALLGAELAPTGLVTSTGPAPAPGPLNRYRVPPALRTLPDDPFQRLDGDVLSVASEAPPSALAEAHLFLRAEPQLELDDPDLRSWVLGVAAGHREQSAQLAEQLRVAVRSHIRIKDLGKADASALETFRQRRGDCSEHANLLTAALRIAGIPARVQVGLVFAADFGGWVGHAWNSAYVGGRWIHLDSAYTGIPRSCYITLGTTSGEDPVGTAAAVNAAMLALYGSSLETLP